MPSAGRMRPNTVSAGSWTTPRHRPVSTITFSSTFVNRPKKPFRSPGTHRRGSCAVVSAFIGHLLVVVRNSRSPRLDRASGRGAPLGGDVPAPAAELGDLALAFAQERLAEDAEHDGAVLEDDLADREARRFVLQDSRQPFDRDVPELERDASALTGRADHRRVAVVDRPDAVALVGRVLAHECRTDLEHVRVQLEAAHQRAVDGEQRRLAHFASIQVPVSPRSARSMFGASVMTPRPPGRRFAKVTSASIFGPMLPAPKWPSAAYASASATVMRSSHC